MAGALIGRKAIKAREKKELLSFLGSVFLPIKWPGAIDLACNEDCGMIGLHFDWQQDKMDSASIEEGAFQLFVGLSLEEFFFIDQYVTIDVEKENGVYEIAERSS